jgi:hypothetical protein
VFFYTFPCLFSFIQQNWGDNDSILRNCPIFRFHIFFRYFSHFFALGALFPSLVSQ